MFINRFSRIRSMGLLSVALFAVSLSASYSYGQESSDNGPAIVQPGAPGKATKTLPANTKAVLPPVSPKDVEFMQGMIMHHAQAVEMTALIASRTGHKGIQGLGDRISQSQADEIEFMKSWLTVRGKKTTMMNMKKDMDHEKMDHSKHQMTMPGMLSPKQMEALRNAKGSLFDRLFLSGMIQHHAGALVMVNDLFSAAGAGQDAELFTFATDVDSTQRAEIRIMQTMLKEQP